MYPLDRRSVRIIRRNYLDNKFSVKELAKQLGIWCPTIYDYIRKFKDIGIRYPQHASNVDFFLPKKVKGAFPATKRYAAFMAALPVLIENSKCEIINRYELWEGYHAMYPNGFTKVTFESYFDDWNRVNKICRYSHKRVKILPLEDIVVLEKWLLSAKREEWRMAVMITESFKSTPVKTIATQIRQTPRTVRKWVDAYKLSGIAALGKKPCLTNERWVIPHEERTINVMKLIHETPKLHGLNRTSWRLTDLVDTYFEIYRTTISSTAIRVIIKQNGFVFKKAKMVLTSPDPKFREKLNHLKSILSNLAEDEKFFSVDELGPCAVKMKEGWSFTPADELVSVPRFQKSKGWFICTAAIELSTNQVTHFYSRHKNSDEMIKLIALLLLQYPTQKKLYISWDGAGWHCSGLLKDFIKKSNELAMSDDYLMPLVEIVPLPSSAQFLNVIESVFSGLARAVIHNSNYASLDECKAAIDWHFQERNSYFLTNPKRAGNTIWGKERVPPVFNETNNCKDPRF